ncbi:hypothetical protein AB0333_15975 [Citricoccus sp. NPDC079358]|uniref:hypothetical protein n=1 Tax=Citricoccus sp. NPDC079358 TaxID=3154653 RepID=UPI00345020EB
MTIFFLGGTIVLADMSGTPVLPSLDPLPFMILLYVIVLAYGGVGYSSLAWLRLKRLERMGQRSASLRRTKRSARSHSEGAVVVKMGYGEQDTPEVSKQVYLLDISISDQSKLSEWVLEGPSDTCVEAVLSHGRTTISLYWGGGADPSLVLSRRC